MPNDLCHVTVKKTIHTSFVEPFRKWLVENHKQSKK